MSNLFDKKDVFSWSNCEEARQYIGEEGYFRDTYCESLAAWHRGILQDVDQSMPVDCIFEDDENEVFGLFLPVGKVLPVPMRPKKYRPFKSIEEFRKTLNNINFLDALTFREKHYTFRKYCAVFNGYGDSNDELDGVGFGGAYKTPVDLFNHYEWYDEKTEKWMPFGVEE